MLKMPLLKLISYSLSTVKFQEPEERKNWVFFSNYAVSGRKTLFLTSVSLNVPNSQVKEIEKKKTGKIEQTLAREQAPAEREKNR